ncbi:HNH endonuclease signature motif containing protein [Nitratireductor alexandrii]|uniref:HNH endonuclease signature motif containing protein n=1 Tax=Nitratireductor alexandrii TaxID=2448161 RepID=UPI0030844AC2
MHNRCGRPATVVHHVKPHRGDKRLFWDRSNWMPACQPCHDGPLQAQERRR